MAIWIVNAHGCTHSIPDEYKTRIETAPNAKPGDWDNWMGDRKYRYASEAEIEAAGTKEADFAKTHSAVAEAVQVAEPAQKPGK